MQPEVRPSQPPRESAQVKPGPTEPVRPPAANASPAPAVAAPVAPPEDHTPVQLGQAPLESEAISEPYAEPGAELPPSGAAEPLPIPRPMPSSGAVRVGFLVPLSGQHAWIGKAMLNAAQLSLFAFANDKLELLVLDTQGTPQGAKDAMSLALGDGARLIVGPLLATSVQAAAPAARTAGVPVVAFSNDRSVANPGIFTMGFLPRTEVQTIVAYAISQGLTRFAVLAPANDYGNAVVAALNEVTAAGGAMVVRSHQYDPALEDFSQVVKSFSDHGARRQALMNQRRELKGRSDEAARRALARLDQLEASGELPFDALLIAEGGKRLQNIAAHLPFYDIDPSKVHILGTGRWDEPGIGAEPALVGAWFAAPDPAARTSFEGEYKSLYGKAPPRLATIAYDAMALAAVLGKSEDGGDFSLATLTTASGFAGRDGIFRLLATGEIERGLAVLRVQRHGFDVIQPAPGTFIPASN